MAKNIRYNSCILQRVVAKKWSGDDVISEKCPMKFPIPDKKGYFKICSAPWAYIRDLPSHIIHYLDSLKK